ncbi:DegT/DnrJ/EryC1/StrS family aminotransferase [Mucilaginibacter sp. AW1-3]
MNKEIGIVNTYIAPDASAWVNKVLDSTFISEGKLVKEFENKLADYLGIINPVALNSGTSALHLALDVAGVGEGDEVILPAQTFVATGLVILQQKAVPVFADIDYDTGNISVADIKAKITAKTKAIMPVHWAGYPCDMDAIMQLARQHGLIVIEDAAHALGALYNNKPIGSIGDYTCFSFQAIKHVTTGDGGALSTIHQDKYHSAYRKRWFGIDRAGAATTELGERSYSIEQIGYKYHLNDYGAALGLANLVGFKERLNHRKQLASIYTSNLDKVAGVTLLETAQNKESAHWLYGIHVDNRLGFIRKLKEKGITASVIHQRIDRNEIFGSLKDLPVQKRFDETQIHIPIHDAVSLEDAEYIVETIKSGW